MTGFPPILELERDGDRFLAVASQDINPDGRLFGGLIAAQSLAAAGATIEDAAKVAHSLHAYFVRGGQPGVDLEYIVERTRDGRSFDTRRVTVVQDGKVILELLASFHVAEPGVDEHPPAPPMPPVEECLPLSRLPGGTGVVDMRAPDGAFRGPPHWVRLRDTVVDDPLVRACMLTFVSDMGLMAAARPPGLQLPFPTNAMAASLDHSIWFHRPYVPDQWHCYQAHPLNHVGARGLAIGGMYDEGGVLIATIAQEALWRVVPG